MYTHVLMNALLIFTVKTKVIEGFEEAWTVALLIGTISEFFLLKNENTCNYKQIVTEKYESDMCHNIMNITLFKKLFMDDVM